MLKIKKMVDQETRENILDSNPYFSPIFCGYPPNNWCGIVPLPWIVPLHFRQPYRDWRELNAQNVCVTNSPKSQGILKF